MAPRKQVKKSRPAVRKAVEDRRSESERLRAIEQERMDSSQPTPTQEENDLFRVGEMDIDDKEDHGGESEADLHRRMMEAKLASSKPAPYQTRDARADTNKD